MSNLRPLVSVIIPVYNHERFVAEALNSVLYQTYPNIELIIIDDGSKDESCRRVKATVDEWNKAPKHLRTIHFIEQPNMGAHATINKGLALAKGDWLTILNSDDLYGLNRIENLINHVSAARAQFAFTYVSGIDEKGKLLSPDHWWTRWYEGARFQLLQAPTVGFQLLQDNLAVSTGNLFFTRQLYDEVGPFKNLKLAHDLDFILRALPLAEPAMLREELYFYRLHGSNTQYDVAHLHEKEFQEIYREYLMRIAVPQAVKNPVAPSPWNWPSEFPKWRTKLKMDRGLRVYIKDADTAKKESSVREADQKSKVTVKKGRKVTLISHDLSLSGAPKLVLDLALCLKNHGYRPNVIAMNDGPMREVLERNGISVAAPSGSTLKRMLMLSIIIFFYAKKITIVNTLVSLPAMIILSLLRPFQQLYWYIHDSYTPSAYIHNKFGGRGRVLNPFLRMLRKRRSLQLWFGSKSTQSEWRNSGFQKGEVRYWSGIPKQTKQRECRSRLTHFLAVGSASARKGTFTLIDAFISCLKENRIPQDCTLTIVGFPSGKEVEYFLHLTDAIMKVMSSGYQDQIKLVSSADPDQLDAYYDAADVFVQASILECLPISILSAMSKGMPIISTDVDGCPEAVRHMETGYLCLPYHAHALADAMVYFANNPEVCQGMGIRAQEVFNEEFSLEATQDKILNAIVA